MSAFSALPVRRVEEHPLAPMDRGSWPASLAPVHQILAAGLDLSPVTVLVGDNGTGKSTIVEALAAAFGLNPEGGTHAARHETRATESMLVDHLQLVRGAALRSAASFCVLRRCTDTSVTLSPLARTIYTIEATAKRS